MEGLSDTDPKIERILDEMWRNTPGWRKIELVGMLNQTVRELALAGIRIRYPKASEPEVQRRLADIILGAELALAAFGPVEKARQDGRD